MARPPLVSEQNGLGPPQGHRNKSAPSMQKILWIIGKPPPSHSLESVPSSDSFIQPCEDQPTSSEVLLVFLLKILSPRAWFVISNIQVLEGTLRSHPSNYPKCAEGHFG